MILYKGQIYKNSKQVELINTLESDTLKTLSSSTVITTDDVINACDQLTKKIIDGLYDHIIIPLLEEFDIPNDYFMRYVSMFNKESLQKKVEIELGSKTLSKLDSKNRRERHPLGVLFHIAAGNLDVLPAYSVIEGLLVGNINILKLPSGDKGVSVELLSELINIEPKLKDYIYVFDVASTEVETLKQLASISDATIVWGGDEAVKAARRMVPINSKVIEWGHKLSFAYASMNTTDQELTDLAHHICSTDQLLCSSAQGIYLDTSNYEEVKTFAKRFFDLFVEANKLHKEVPFGLQAKNAVELYYEQMVQDQTNKLILKKDGVSVIASKDNDLELSMLFRNVWIKPLPKEDIVRTIKPHKNHLQSVTILSTKEEYSYYVDLFVSSGLVRIKSPKELSDVLIGESHDGMYPLRVYSRVVEIYEK